MAVPMKSVSATRAAWPSIAVSGCMFAWIMLLATVAGNDTGLWLSSLGWAISCAALLIAPYLLIAALWVLGHRTLAMGASICFLASFWLMDWSFLRFLFVHELGIMKSSSGTLMADALAKSFKGLEAFAAVAVTIPLVASASLSRVTWLDWLVNLVLPTSLAIIWLCFFYAIHDSIEAAAGAGAGAAAIVIAQLMVNRRMGKAEKL